MDSDERIVIDHSDTNVANLSVVLSIIDLREDGPLEYQGRLIKIDSVLLQICPILAFVVADDPVENKGFNTRRHVSRVFHDVKT
jgi:hypothetical protein